MMDIVGDMMSSNVSGANSGATYIRRSTVGKMKIKHQGVLLFLVKLSEDAATEKTFGKT